MEAAPFIESYTGPVTPIFWAFRPWVLRGADSSNETGRGFTDWERMVIADEPDR
jgi:hypothetical protein